jgi:aspartyl/asparaginyl-tRNA synthetase
VTVNCTASTDDTAITRYRCDWGDGTFTEQSTPIIIRTDVPNDGSDPLFTVTVFGAEGLFDSGQINLSAVARTDLSGDG